MNLNQQKKLTSRQQAKEQQQVAEQQQTQTPSVREFHSAEEMLRHDALHTPVPPSIAHRLRESVGRAPAPPQSWWRRLLGK